MSKIAEALVKAKERTGTTTAPFLVSAPTGAHAVPEVDPAKTRRLRKAHNTQRFWIALLPVVFVATTVAIWSRLRSPSDAPEPVATVAASPAPATPASTARSAPASAGTVAADSSPKAPPADVAIPPRAELYNVVNGLTVTAVLPGERPRLMYRSRIVAVGEAVEGELVFAGVREGNIVLTDQRGAVYLRRY